MLQEINLYIYVYAHTHTHAHAKTHSPGVTGVTALHFALNGVKSDGWSVTAPLCGDMGALQEAAAPPGTHPHLAIERAGRYQLHPLGRASRMRRRASFSKRRGCSHISPTPWAPPGRAPMRKVESRLPKPSTIGGCKGTGSRPTANAKQVPLFRFSHSASARIFAANARFHKKSRHQPHITAHDILK